MALETSGYNIQAQMPDLAQANTLAALRPLSFAGGGASPVNIQPLAGWKVESARPEQVMAGMAAGGEKAAQGITQGIQAIYLDKKKKEDLKASQAREDALLSQKHGWDVELAGIKSGENTDRLLETIRHNKEMEEIKTNIGERGGNLGKSLAPRSLDNNVPPTTQDDASSAEPVRFFGNEPQTDYLQKGSSSSLEGIPLGQNISPDKSNVLANLGMDISNVDNLHCIQASSPFPSSQSADVSGNVALQSEPNAAISNDAASSIFKKYNAGSSPFQAGSAPEQQVDAGLEKQAAIARFAATQDIPLQKQFGLLASQQPPNKVMEDAMGINAVYPEQQALALRTYARSKGLPEPTLAARQGGVEVVWPTYEQAQRGKELADFGQQRIDLRKKNQEINTYNQSVDKYNTDPTVKQAVEKIKPTMEKFFGDLTELNRMGEGYGRRSVLDQSLIDQYIRFATGSIPSEAQYKALTKNRTLMDKLHSLYGKNTGESSTSLLAPEERKSMAESMTNVLNQEHSGLNTKIDSKRRIVDGLKNASITEDNKPHHYPIMKMEADVQKEIAQTEKDLRSAWGDGKNQQPKDVEAYKAAAAKHAQLAQQLEVAKTGIPANFDELKNYGENVNGVTYPSGWSGRLIYDEAPPHPVFTNPNVGEQ